MKPKTPSDPTGQNHWTISARSLFLALITAILTGAISYVYGVVNDNRKAKLDFVNAQIEKLYGPLLAANHAGNAIWDLFGNSHWRHARNPKDKSRVYFNDRDPPTVDEVRLWRQWMRTVFQPLNVKMEEAIIANSHLVIGDTIPPVFQDLAHTEAYKAVIASWKDEDFKECQQRPPRATVVVPCTGVTRLMNTAELNFPEELVQCVEADYLKLKQYQKLLQSSLFTALLAQRVTRSPACDRQVPLKQREQRSLSGPL
jgi:hypothetical protein